ncbi:hypothetical protein B0H14DRAFT_2563264 [Mycena olivaceomarginata]|nr:hypothetical protein B0H14DRAFT_2563264 [Mycena olivaceomarginata]
MLLHGKTPSAHAAPLHNKRIKRDLIHTKSLRNTQMALALKRYIHSYLKSDKGEIIIVTFVPYLLKLLDDPGITSFDGGDPMRSSACALKFSDPEYSGIPKDTPPEKVAPKFIKLCWCHGKEPVHDFKSLVSAAQYQRLVDFVHVDSKESLDEFSSFVYDLGVPKITNWWRHKEMHRWIIPCIVKSQSLIPADVWDSTPSGRTQPRHNTIGPIL